MSSKEIQELLQRASRKGTALLCIWRASLRCTNALLSPRFGHIHFHNSRDENEVYGRQSRSLLASGRSPRFPTLAQRCRQRASITPHLAARDRSRDAIGQKRQPHTFTRHQSHRGWLLGACGGNCNLPHSPQRNERAHDGGNQQSVNVSAGMGIIIFWVNRDRPTRSLSSLRISLDMILNELTSQKIPHVPIH